MPAGDALLLVHELRQPVAAITAAAGGLAREDLDRATRARLLALVQGEAQRLARMLDEVADAARLDAGDLPVRPVPCDVAALVRAALEVLRLRLPHDRGAQLKVAPGTPNALADPDRVAQVLANLLDNALVHGAGRVRVTVAPSRGHVRVEIADEGPGIPVGARDSVFERHVRLDTRVAGTGLGLWLVRSLCERMGGSARAEDGGFVVELPAAG